MAYTEPYFRHSLRVNDYLCQGCTTCMRSCPTGAIRIRNGKAIVADNKCVDCGECMKVYFFALITVEGFLISPCYPLELRIQMGVSFLFSLAFCFSSHSYL